jgi:hypothetical protein
MKTVPGKQTTYLESEREKSIKLSIFMQRKLFEHVQNAVNLVSNFLVLGHM